jgi:hypothetical protein
MQIAFTDKSKAGYIWEMSAAFTSNSLIFQLLPKMIQIKTCKKLQILRFLASAVVQLKTLPFCDVMWHRLVVFHKIYNSFLYEYEALRVEHQLHSSEQGAKENICI